jgi:hypothetical protein
MQKDTLTAGAVTFRATLLSGGKTATGIHVPDEVVAALSTSKRLRVRVTMGSYTYRSTVAPMRGRSMLPVSAEVREGAGVAAGDELQVVLELDDEPREVTVPPDLTAALDGESEAVRFFEGLSYTNRLRFVLSIEGAKTPETRQRRIEKAVSALREGRTA